MESPNLMGTAVVGNVYQKMIIWVILERCASKKERKDMLRNGKGLCKGPVVGLEHEITCLV